MLDFLLKGNKLVISWESQGIAKREDIVFTP